MRKSLLIISLLLGHFLSFAQIDYEAHFSNCTFTVDGGYLGTEVFHKHIDLARVKGVKFNGCSFFADPSVQGVSPLDNGIAGHDAGDRGVHPPGGIVTRHAVHPQHAWREDDGTRAGRQLRQQGC